jgi:hypothetical protein
MQESTSPDIHNKTSDLRMFETNEKEETVTGIYDDLRFQELDGKHGKKVGTRTATHLNMASTMLNSEAFGRRPSEDLPTQATKQQITIVQKMLTKIPNQAAFGTLVFEHIFKMAP